MVISSPMWVWSYVAMMMCASLGLCALFVAMTTGANTRWGGDINVLLCGDPGTAKSQFLKSAMGLTAYMIGLLSSP